MNKECWKCWDTAENKVEIIKSFWVILLKKLIVFYIVCQVSSIYCEVLTKVKRVRKETLFFQCNYHWGMKTVLINGIGLGPFTKKKKKKKKKKGLKKFGFKLTFDFRNEEIM